VNWVHRQDFTIIDLGNPEKFYFEKLFISTVDSIDFEGDITPFPFVITSQIESSVKLDDYIFVPTGQLKGNLLILGLEPQSELGLATYRQFSFLMEAESMFPVIRVRLVSSEK
jgi:hypothetical protein